MTDLGKLTYTLTLNDEGFGEQVEADTQKVKESGDQMSSSMDDTAESTGRLGGAFSGMVGQFVEGAVIFTAGQKIITTIKSAIDDAVQSAKDWQTQQVGLNAELTSTHDASGLTAAQITNLAEQTQALTPISREAALEGENMLLTFTNLGSTVFPQVVKATEDMATRLNGGAIPSGQQLSDTALQVGKALNDPINGLAKLQREGVTFTQQQKDQVKAMQDAGNMAGAQSVMIAELNKEFGGSAAADMNTYQGQLAEIKNRFDDLVGSSIQKLIGAFQQLAIFLLEHKALLATVGGAVLGLSIAIGVALVTALWAVVAPAIAAVIALWPIIAIGAAIGLIAYEIISHWSELQAWWASFVSTVKGYADDLVNAWNATMQGFESFFNGVKQGFADVGNTIKAIFEDVVNFLKPIAIVLLAIMLFPLVPAALAWRAWHTQIMQGFNDAINFIKTVLGAFVQFVEINVNMIISFWVGFFNLLKTAFTDAVNFIVTVFTPIIAFFQSFMSTLTNTITGPVQNFGTILFDAGKNIITGMINGIKSMAGEVWNAITDVGKGIENAAKAELKIFSPSQVFSDIGANVSLGLAKGITDTSSQATAATTNLTTGVVGAGSRALASIPQTNVANNSQASSVVYQIAQVVLQGAEAVDEFFSIGNRNTQLESIGFGSLPGTTGV